MPKDLTNSRPGGLPNPAKQSKTGGGTNRGDRQGSTGKRATPLSQVVRRPNRPPTFRR